MASEIAEQAAQAVDEVQRRMDAVVNAAVEWCESGEEGVSVADSFEKSEALSNAVYRLKQLRNQE